MMILILIIYLFADLETKFVSKLILSFKSPIPNILNFVTFFLINLFDFNNFKSIFVDD